MEDTPPTFKQRRASSSEEEAVVASVSKRKTPEARLESDAVVSSIPTEKASSPIRRSYADVLVGVKPQSVVEVVGTLDWQAAKGDAYSTKKHFKSHKDC